MNKSTYLKLSKDLQQLCKTVPLNWGKVQNNTTDAKLNMFAIHNIEALDIAIQQSTLSQQDKNYFRRRWFLWQCAKVDEYLFYSHENIIQNPNSRDKNWDIEFFSNKNLRFDIKGTVVPKVFRTHFSVKQEAELINFYYNNQSKGIRYGYQNRIFLVHHSFRNATRNIYLRCHWTLKIKALQVFIEQMKAGINFIPYKNLKAKCIFITETKDNKFTFHIN